MITIAALVTEPGTAVEFYRGWGVLRYLDDAGGEPIRVTFMDPDKVGPADLYQVDVVFCLRPFAPGLADIFEDAKRIGVKVWIDFDDDLVNLPLHHPAFFKVMTPNAKEAVGNFAKMADLITVSTTALKERFGPINENVVVVRNAWNDFLWSRKAQRSPAGVPLKVAWRGSNTHSGDLATIADTLKFLANSHRYELRMHGFIPYWLKGQFSATPFVPLFEWFNFLERDPADAFVVPLEDNTFNKAKSDIGYIEATKAGAVCFAPSYMPEFDRPGAVLYSDQEDLKEKLDRFRRNKLEKVKKVSTAAAYIHSERTLSKANAIRSNAIKNLF